MKIPLAIAITFVFVTGPVRWATPVAAGGNRQQPRPLRPRKKADRSIVQRKFGLTFLPHVFGMQMMQTRSAWLQPTVARWRCAPWTKQPLA